MASVVTLELRNPMGRGLILGIFGALSLFAIPLVGQAIAGGEDGPGWGFTAFWIGALVWNAYWWLLRISFCVRLTPTALEWETPLRRGSVPVGSLTAARPSRMGSTIEVFECGVDRPVLMYSTKGMGELLAALSEARPLLPIRMGRIARRTERMRGRSGLRRLDDPSSAAGPPEGGR